MRVELREMRNQGGQARSTANYVAFLQNKGKLKLYVSPKGYASYDTREYEQYKKKVRKGRPIKHLGDLENE